MNKPRDPLHNSWRHIQQSLSDWNMKDAKRAQRLGLDCEWQNFKSFRDDVVAKLGPKPANKKLARIDMTEGWRLSNLSYVNQHTLSQRQITTIRVKYKGKNYCAKEFAKLSSVSYWTMLKRLRRGDSAKRALRPPRAP
jgi:hypothetical protein